MLNKIKLSFGYNVMQIATVNVYTAKIRVKTDMNTVNEFISWEDRTGYGITVYDGKNQTMIISWATTDSTTHQQFIGKMNRLMAYVMHGRIAVKYGELAEQVPEPNW